MDQACARGKAPWHEMGSGRPHAGFKVQGSGAVLQISQPHPRAPQITTERHYGGVRCTLWKETRMSKYNKLIAALVGVGVMIAARHFDLTLPGMDAIVMDLIIGALTSFGVYQVENKA
jgi:hypothetical protein